MISAFQKKKFLIHFGIYDFDNNGVIEKTDLQQALNVIARGFGWAIDSPAYQKIYDSFVEARWQQLSTHADTNNDQKISPEEYVEYLTALLQDKERYEFELLGPVRRSFKFMDRDDDGFIGLSEYKQVYASLGLDEGIAETVFDKLGLNKNDQIAEQAYLILIEQFFKSQDQTDPGNYFFGPIE